MAEVSNLADLARLAAIVEASDILAQIGRGGRIGQLPVRGGGRGDRADTGSMRDEILKLTAQVVGSAAVLMDRVQVQQVLFNLLRNGIEAMQDQPDREIVVTASPCEGGMIEVSVADCGPGLPEAVRDELFQPFVTTKPDWMGVGLSVCRTIVEAHSGQLWADAGDSRGAVFRFTLPAVS